MPISAEWYNEEKTVIIYYVVYPATPQKFYQMMDEVDALLMEVPHTVELLGDYTQAKKAPPDAFAAARRIITKAPPPNLGHIILVGRFRFLELMLSIFSAVYPRQTSKMQVVRSIDEAETLIQSIQQQREQA